MENQQTRTFIRKDWHGYRLILLFKFSQTFHLDVTQGGRGAGGGFLPFVQPCDNITTFACKTNFARLRTILIIRYNM